MKKILLLLSYYIVKRGESVFKLSLIIFFICCTCKITFAQTTTTKSSTTQTSKQDSTLIRLTDSLIKQNTAILTARLDSADDKDTDFVIQLKCDSLVPFIFSQSKTEKKVNKDSVKLIDKRIDSVNKQLKIAMDSAAVITNKLADLKKLVADSIKLEGEIKTYKSKRDTGMEAKTVLKLSDTVKVISQGRPLISTKYSHFSNQQDSLNKFKNKLEDLKLATTNPFAMSTIKKFRQKEKGYDTICEQLNKLHTRQTKLLKDSVNILNTYNKNSNSCLQYIDSLKKAIKFNAAIYGQNGIPITNVEADSIIARHVDSIMKLTNVVDVEAQPDPNFWKDLRNNNILKLAASDTQQAKSKFIDSIQKYFRSAISMKLSGKRNHDSLSLAPSDIVKLKKDSLNDIAGLDSVSFKVTNVHFNYSFDGNIYNMTIDGQHLISHVAFQLFYLFSEVPLTNLKNVQDIVYDTIHIDMGNGFNKDAYIRMVDILGFTKYYDKNQFNFNRSSNSSATVGCPNPIRRYVYAASPFSYFRVNIATDLLGLLSSNNANGKVQFEFNAYFNLGNRSNPKVGSRPKTGFSMFRNIDPTFSITKIGISNAFILLNPISSKNPVDSVSTSQLQQYSSFNFGSRINIFTWNIQKKYTTFLYLNYIWRYYNTPVSIGDSIINQTSYSNSLELVANFYYAHNKVVFVPSLSVSNFHFYDQNHDILQYDYEPVSVYHTIFLKQEVAILAHNVTVCPQFYIYYSPTGETNNRIFFKANYSYQNGNGRDGFMQLQFGYTADIRNLAKIFSSNSSSTTGKTKSPGT